MTAHEQKKAEPALPEPAVPEPPPVEAAPPVLRPEVASLLATEHWSLLGTRSLTWNEIMSRITIYLTVVSAFLVVLALVASATGLGVTFRVMSIGFAATALVMGTLTSLRVVNASNEDAQLVRAMNRLRRAYVELAPEIEPYLTASTHDDESGLQATYALGMRRSGASHFIASTAFFLITVNTLVAGTLGALIAAAAGTPTPVTVSLGVATGLAYLGGQMELARRQFGILLVDVRFPSPEPVSSRGSGSGPRRTRRGSTT
ncbi:hypothetical protein [Intrasporangium sp.]|uniref:hypothetical protein n=1 Tax=Intrasporangium sp. TaxID=1925024 RepID=UPI00293A0009|nr:hypothetical protein [Intrasporangium sp.]MDV3220302.1 hypothetical protein [Intrasporangium sp.]